MTTQLSLAMSTSAMRPLNKRANQLARTLQKLSVGPDTVRLHFHGPFAGYDGRLVGYP